MIQDRVGGNDSSGSMEIVVLSFFEWYVVRSNPSLEGSRVLILGLYSKLFCVPDFKSIYVFL